MGTFVFKGEIRLTEVLWWDWALAAAGRLIEVRFAAAECCEMTCALARDQGAEGGVEEGCDVRFAGDDGARARRLGWGRQPLSTCIWHPVLVNLIIDYLHC